MVRITFASNATNSLNNSGVGVAARKYQSPRNDVLAAAVQGGRVAMEVLGLRGANVMLSPRSCPRRAPHPKPRYEVPNTICLGGDTLRRMDDAVVRVMLMMPAGFWASREMKPCAEPNSLS
jgi:hypothetical protein